MIWFGLIIAVVGYFIYRMDKNFKKKYEDKFNPKDWELPSAAEASSLATTPRATQNASQFTQATSQLMYEKKEALLTPAEKLLFDALYSAVGNEYRLLVKIAVADVIKITNERSSSDPLVEKQFTFVVCDKNRFAIRCAIEFIDKFQTHSRTSSSSANSLSDICRGAQLSMLSINRELKYDVQQLRTQLLAAMNVVDEAYKTPDAVGMSGASMDERSASNACPKCAAAMVKRKARNAAQEERLLWVCTRYPECKGRMAVNE